MRSEKAPPLFVGGQLEHCLLRHVSGRPFLTFREIYLISYSIIQETEKQSSSASHPPYLCELLEEEVPRRCSVSVRRLPKATVCESTQQSVSMLSIRLEPGTVPQHSSKQECDFCPG